MSRKTLLKKIYNRQTYFLNQSRPNSVLTCFVFIGFLNSDNYKKYFVLAGHLTVVNDGGIVTYLNKMKNIERISGIFVGDSCSGNQQKFI